MLKVELIPDLDQCIETVAKREHATVLKQLLGLGKGNRELEGRLEIIRLFLETADFKRLRAESEKRFVEGRKVKFVVYLEEGMPKYEMHLT